MDNEIRYLVVVLDRFEDGDARLQRLIDILDRRRSRLQGFAKDLLRSQDVDEGPSLRFLPAMGAIIISERLVPAALLDGKHPLSPYCHLIRDVEGIGDKLAPSRHLAPKRSFGLKNRDRKGIGVLVGVVDSGFDPDPHRDGSRILAAWEFKKQVKAGNHYGGPMNPVEDRNQPTSRSGPGGPAFSRHGTKMCDRIATGSDAIAPSARIAVATALTSTRHGRPVGELHQIVGGLEWLLTWPFRNGQLGCDVINLSYVFGGAHQTHWRGLVQLLKNPAICNKLIVHSVGNDADPTLNCPMTNDANVLSVGSVEPGSTKWDTRNNYNVAQQRPNLCAPATSSSYAAATISGLAALCVERIGRTERRKVRKAVISLAVAPVKSKPDRRLQCRTLRKVSKRLARL